ncbi:hypothetical protein LINPERHAP2_LOCUS11854 [Linum perenne]
MLSSSDKRGGVNFSVSHSCPFVDCCNVCGFVDPGSIGPTFTWFRGTLLERLDRGMINGEWKVIFPLAKIRHLRRIYSDHRPIIFRILTKGGLDCLDPFGF